MDGELEGDRLSRRWREQPRQGWVGRDRDIECSDGQVFPGKDAVGIVFDDMTSYLAASSRFAGGPGRSPVWSVHRRSSWMIFLDFASRLHQQNRK